MEGVPSSAAVDAVVRATKSYAQQRPMAPPHAAAAGWSGLPEDLLLIIMTALDVPNLIRSGAVCTSWRDACSTFRLPALKQAPCLLYACDECGPNDAILYCPSTDAKFRVPFPGPPHEKRGFVFSCNGWVFAVDEVGNPYLFNPMTGVQAALPPLNTIAGDFYDNDGKHVFFDGDTRVGDIWARHSHYVRVAISAAAEVAACTVLIVHDPQYTLSFARPGDKRWTLLPDGIRCDHIISDVLYNEKDGLFYILHHRGSVCTLDLGGPSPSVATVIGQVSRYGVAQLYLALTPSGDLLQLWRICEDLPVKNRWAYHDVRRHALQDCIEFAEQDGNSKLADLEGGGDGEDELSEEDTDGVSTTELLVFKVDTDRRKLVELRDIGGHAFFLGYNATVCLPTRGFQPLEPNCAYLTDDSCSHGPVPAPRKDLGIWNIKKRSMLNLGDAWPSVHSWLDIPS